MKYILSFVWAAVFSFLSLTIAAEPSSDIAADPLIGKWIFHNKEMRNYVVTIKADGTAHSSAGNSKGKWKFIESPSSERKYEIYWKEGVAVDYVQLSKDGTKLSGKNYRDLKLSGRRPPTTEKPEK